MDVQICLLWWDVFLQRNKSLQQNTLAFINYVDLYLLFNANVLYSFQCISEYRHALVFKSVCIIYWFIAYQCLSVCLSIWNSFMISAKALCILILEFISDLVCRFTWIWSWKILISGTRRCSMNQVSLDVYGLSQWETTLHCNVVSHWMSSYPEWSLWIMIYISCPPMMMYPAHLLNWLQLGHALLISLIWVQF